MFPSENRVVPAQLPISHVTSSLSGMQEAKNPFKSIPGASLFELYISY